jgi:hypothetical protein
LFTQVNDVVGVIFQYAIAGLLQGCAFITPDYNGEAVITEPGRNVVFLNTTTDHVG